MKWYADGQERGHQAITMIKALLNDLKQDDQAAPLQSVLHSYQTEIEAQTTAVPLILSRMNIAIANVIQKEGLDLSASQQAKLKEMTALSMIRYGY
ncbi:bacteriocin immunity protein [Latilactobacillus curvatus]|uniref:bacteriocin immunity protein n=1 Tax=Latilactobacillus curvatus TaxID=28038 RepID=UPI00081520FB|nr:bacteriocin immunity protein [Latilactobacillus curvatus]ANY14245.1 bacteriocin immunity protein [Latilactobacillus curvatus]MCM0725739.1 bacteriocin immunity protein [Latilactobacillus curvatus]MCP8847879.1 bacteriocin immunity protein [Latilactobacillus curvatus]MCP8849683.1 bacteriocin immunity protein [Latilactobacillus curvatus]MCP8863741.1 bacteriocin immunity protein [Latilactobacillus curvatus]